MLINRSSQSVILTCCVTSDVLSLSFTPSMFRGLMTGKQKHSLGNFHYRHRNYEMRVEGLHPIFRESENITQIKKKVNIEKTLRKRRNRSTSFPDNVFIVDPRIYHELSRK